MDFIEKLIPHLIFAAALLPTLLLLAAAAVSLSNPDPLIAVPLPVQAATCWPCQTEPAE
jgi:hypothetical protein